MTTAPQILNKAIVIQSTRGAERDAEAERSMGKIVAAFNIIHDTELTEVQGWQFMELLKMVRSTRGEYHEDDYVDGASYASLAGEAASSQRR